MSARVISTVPLLVLFAASVADAQGFASGQTITVTREPRFQPAGSSNDPDPARERAKAQEARDRTAATRRSVERELAAKQAELDRLDQQAGDIEAAAARTVEGAVKSAKELGTRISDARSTNPMTQAKAGEDGLKDLNTTLKAANDFAASAVTRQEGRRSQLRSEIKQLKGQIELFRQMERIYHQQVDEAQDELDAENGFAIKTTRDRAAAVAYNAKREQELQALIAAAAKAQAAATATSSTPSTSGDDHDPSRSGGERAGGKESGKDRPHGEIRVGGITHRF